MDPTVPRQRVRKSGSSSKQASSVLAHAEQIGTEIIREGLSYCEDDNTYTPYTITMKAWACPVALCSPLTSARPLTAEELFTEMFGDS